MKNGVADRARHGYTVHRFQ